MSNYFPFFVDISEWHILVVGGGRIAARRIGTLAGFCQDITVLSEELHPDLKQLAEERRIRWVCGKYAGAYVAGMDLVLACTNDSQVNEAIYRECKEQKILVNDCSCRERCDFYFPGIARSGDVVAGITAGGNGHRRAAQITQAVRELIEENAMTEGKNIERE